MLTRLSRFCDRLIEGGWLAALVVTPLFFNLLSARNFEPDKAALLRAIVLVALVGWVGWRLFRPRATDATAFEWRSAAGWLLLSVGGLAVILVVSALLGLNPRISLLGSYNRDQGVVTHLAYLALFALVAARLRAADQLQRLLDTVVIVSLATGVYGLLQRLGIDPVPWGGFGEDVTSRVIGTQGNASFLGGYLVLAMLVTLYGLLTARGAGRSGASVAYSVALAFQLLALLFTDSRGATLGLAAGLVVWAAAHAAWRGDRRLAGGVAAVAGAGIASLLLLNLAGGALDGVPLLGRLGRLTDPTVGSNQLRALVWEGMDDMVRGEAARLTLGVGPDALYLAYYPYIDPELRRIDNPTVGTHDRSHNELLDRLAMTGVLGLGAWLAVIGGLLYGACAWLGLTEGGRRWWLMAALALGLALGGLTPLLMTGSLRFAGLGGGIGLVGGLVIWLTLRAFRPPAASAGEAGVAVIPMLLGVLVTHVVEIQVGIPVTATQTLFWTLAGAMTAVGISRLKEPMSTPVAAAADGGATVSERAATRTRSARGRRAARGGPSVATSGASAAPSQPALLFGLVAGLALATLTYGLVQRGIGLGPALMVLLLLGGAVLAVGAALVAGPAAFLTTAFSAWVTAFILHLPAALATATAGLFAFSLFVILVIAWMGAFAWLAAQSVGAVAEERPPAGRLAAWSLAALAAVVGIWFLTLRPIYADSYVRLGQLYGQINRWDLSVAAYENALRYAPEQDFIRPGIAQAYLAQAQTATDAATRQAAFDRSRAILEEATRLSPGNPEYLINLGAAEQYWAERGPAESKLRLQSDAAAHYQAATALAPRDPHALRRWGRLKLEEGSPAEAIPLLEKALALLLPDGTMSTKPLTTGAAAEIRTDLARAYAATGRTTDAVTQARAALSLAAPEAQAPIQELLKQLGASGS